MSNDLQQLENARQSAVMYSHELERKIESQAREIKELKAQLPNRNRHSVMVISELRAALVEAVERIERLYGPFMRIDAKHDPVLTRCKEVLRVPDR
jgi:chromosome segregation ATPase